MVSTVLSNHSDDGRPSSTSSPAFSFFVLFIKDTALASQIGVIELTFAGKVMANKGFPAALTFGTVLVLYFALSWPLARFGRWMEARLAPARTR